MSKNLIVLYDPPYSRDVLFSCLFLVVSCRYGILRCKVVEALWKGSGGKLEEGVVGGKWEKA